MTIPTSTPPAPAPMYTLATPGPIEAHLTQEFLLTNGMGAFAGSTVLGCNTRRYHSLLVAATQPPLGRVNTISRIGEILYLDGKNDVLLETSVNQFVRGNFHPRGDRYLKSFSLGTTATWQFDIEGVQVSKELQLVWGQNLAAVRYIVRPDRPRPIRFELLPFVALRDFHALRRGAGTPYDIHIAGPVLRVTMADNSHPVFVRASAGTFLRQPLWWTDHRYLVETERGQDDLEDLLNPGRLVLEASNSFTVTLWIGLSDPGPRDFDAELWRRPEVASPPSSVLLPRRGQPAPLTPVMQRLVRAAGDFVVGRQRPDKTPGVTILAGYPWFADWGRDTMIALPGLLLSTGRLDEARQVLTLFAQYVSEGMIPNHFDDYDNHPSYNTVDASLWFIHACYEYLHYSQDNPTFEQNLLPACREILRGYREGTRFGIKMDAVDGLINQGDASTQLTWMDAKVDNVVFTPRNGKPVEINALWYNALMLMGEDQLAQKVNASFQKAFWISPFRGLADVVSGSGPYQRDSSIRPNQIFAASLPHSPLAPAQQAAVVETVRRELLTPFGLRTLSRSHPHYKGRYTGNRWNRDAAYHNGTVWPWLIGGFIEAHLRSSNFSDAAKEQARQWLTPLVEHMADRGCIGQIAENFDGDEPQRPVGTPAQAWSVAEVLRAAALAGM